MNCPKCGRENPPGALFCNQCGAALSPAGKRKTGAGASLSQGWRTMRQSFGDLFLSVVIFIALNLPVAAIVFVIYNYTMAGEPNNFFPFELQAPSWELQLSWGALSIFYSLPLLAGLAFAVLAAARHEKIRFGKIFDGFRRYRAVLPLTAAFVVVTNGIAYLLSLLTAHVPLPGALLSLAWSIFYIVMVCKLVFTPLLILDRRMQFIDALRESWKMTRSHEWQVFAIGVVFVLMFAVVWAIAGLVSLIFIIFPVALFAGMLIGLVGFIFLLIWLLATYVSLYEAVNTVSLRTAGYR